MEQGKPTLTDALLTRLSAMVLHLQLSFSITDRETENLHEEQHEKKQHEKEQHKKKLPGFFKVCISHPLPCCLDKFSASCSHEQKTFCLIGKVDAPKIHLLLWIYMKVTQILSLPSRLFCISKQKFLLQYRTGGDLGA